MGNSQFMSIKQFARFTGVSQTTLRYYDEIGLLPAASRAEGNNYRVYEPSQRRLLNFINVLIDLGISLTEIKEIKEARTPESLLNLLSQQEIILDRQLHDLRTAYSIIHAYRRNIQNGLLGDENKIALEALEEARFVLGPANAFRAGEGDMFGDPYTHFCEEAREYRINLRYPIGGYHYDMESFSAAPGQPDKYFSLDPIGNCTREAGQYLTAYKRGDHSGYGDLPEKMAAYARERGLYPTGPVYTLYLLDEISTRDPGQYLLHIAVGVTKRPESGKREAKEWGQSCPLLSSCKRPHCLPEEA